MSYVFHPAAEAEHLESVAYCESKRLRTLGASYLAEFEKTLKDRCAQVDDERTANAAQGRRYFQHPAARYAMLDI